MRTRILATIVAIACIALPLLSQTRAPRATQTWTAPAPRQQTPFTAELKVSSIRTLANGTTISRESTVVRAIDSEGRTMDSTTSITPSGDERTLVNVYDPVARTRANWDLTRKQATVTQMPSPGAMQPACGAIAPAHPAQGTQTALKRSSTTEDLGTETIQGVEARGHKTTITTPAGMVGNDEPLVETLEVWMAIGIGPSGLVVREIRDDPQSGRTTRELTSLTLGDPPLSTFQPPEGYEIVTREMPVPQCAGTQP